MMEDEVREKMTFLEEVEKLEVDIELVWQNQFPPKHIELTPVPFPLRRGSVVLRTNLTQQHTRSRCSVINLSSSDGKPWRRARLSSVAYAELLSKAFCQARQSWLRDIWHKLKTLAYTHEMLALVCSEPLKAGVEDRLRVEQITEEWRRTRGLEIETVTIPNRWRARKILICFEDEAETRICKAMIILTEDRWVDMCDSRIGRG